MKNDPSRNRSTKSILPGRVLPLFTERSDDNTVRQKMKSLAIIVAVLIVLVSLIGSERIGQGFRFLVSDDQTAGAREDGQAASTEATKRKTSVENPNVKLGVEGVISRVPTVEPEDTSGLIGVCWLDAVKGKGIIASDSELGLRIHKTTKLKILAEGGKIPATIADLKVGMKIQGGYTGYMMMHSSPPQVDADFINVLNTEEKK